LEKNEENAISLLKVNAQPTNRTEQEQPVTVDVDVQTSQVMKLDTSTHTMSPLHMVQNRIGGTQTTPRYINYYFVLISCRKPRDANIGMTPRLGGHETITQTTPRIIGHMETQVTPR
jgi:hypothetical protein